MVGREDIVRIHRQQGEQSLEPSPRQGDVFGQDAVGDQFRKVRRAILLKEVDLNSGAGWYRPTAAIRRRGLFFKASQ